MFSVYGLSGSAQQHTSKFEPSIALSYISTNLHCNLQLRVEEFDRKRDNLISGIRRDES